MSLIISKEQVNQNLIEKVKTSQIPSTPETLTSSPFNKFLSKKVKSLFTQASLNNYYKIEQGKKLLHIYGHDFISNLKSQDLPYYNSPYVISSYKRTKIANWMFQIFNSYQSEPKALFLSMNIFDSYCNNCKCPFSNSEIQLIGLTSIYIASKMEDLFPLSLNQLCNNIGLNSFSALTISKMEREILSKINFELINISTYDFVLSFLVDFKVNNFPFDIHNFEYSFIQYEKICVYLTKLLILSDKMFQYKHYIKAIAVLIAAFDIMRSLNKEGITWEIEQYYKKWLQFLIKASKIDKKLIEVIYEKIQSLFNLNLIEH